MGLGTSGGGMVIQNISAGAQFGQTINSGDPLATADAELNYMDEVETALDKPDVPKTPDVHPLDEGVTGDEELIVTSDITVEVEEKPIKLVKACILNLNSGENFEVQFNPTQLYLHKRVWRKEVKGMYGDKADMQYLGSRLLKLKVTLFFDTTEENTDVREKTNLLQEFQKPYYDKEKDMWKTPNIEFLWADFDFVGVIKNVNTDFVKFRMDGLPQRAFTQLSLYGQFNKEDVE